MWDDVVEGDPKTDQRLLGRRFVIVQCGALGTRPPVGTVTLTPPPQQTRSLPPEWP